MHERDGVLTGYLAKPPLVDEARAAWLQGYADEHGVDLAASYGYGDSSSDLRWLEMLGHPTAINPDPDLSREAHRRRWTIRRWRAGGADARRDVMIASRERARPVGSAAGSESLDQED
jgi:alcohol-forming fatty acyl-CoA reductase